MDELLRFTVIRPGEAVEDRFRIRSSPPAGAPPAGDPATAVGAAAAPAHPGTLDTILG
ncbi:hypothetical protein ACGFYQ_36025 [Streptomyces sp. NPDC048258]|uniref:hypothetical protein n=1 Tax=Streptomyces sp. NPDC048258 TaxID=3365527 RepID=UPI0037117FD9